MTTYFKLFGISGSRLIYLYIQYILIKPQGIIYLGLLWQEISNMSSSLEYVISTKLGLSVACQQFLNVSFS